jgi:hypothetical protein
MLDSFKDFSFGETKTVEDVDKLLQEKLGVSLQQCQEALSNALLLRAEEVVPDLPSVAPYGDYGKLMEDPETILTFLQQEAFKEENWSCEFAEIRNKEKDQLMELVFYNKAVDDGDILKGYVFVGLSGKIRHAFAQVYA